MYYLPLDEAVDITNRDSIAAKCYSDHDMEFNSLEEAMDFWSIGHRTPIIVGPKEILIFEAESGKWKPV